MADLILDNIFSPTKYYVPILEVVESPVFNTGSQRSLPILADSQRSWRCDYDNADIGIATGMATAPFNTMQMSDEWGTSRWTRCLRSCKRGWLKFRWRLSRRLFAVPLPKVTAEFDMKLGDVILTIPGIVIAMAYTAWLALHGDVRLSEWPPTIGLLLTFASVIRNNSMLTALTGITFERALFYHKVFAVTTVILTALHGLAHLRSVNKTEQVHDHARIITGLISFGAMVLLLVLSVGVVRRQFFDFFVRAHWVLFIIVMVYAVIHGAALALLGILPWAIDMVYRIVYKARVHAHGSLMKKNVESSLKRSGTGVAARGRVFMVKLADDILRIQFSRVRADTDEIFDSRAGQYVFLCVPSLSMLEWHPFTISSSPHEATVTMHIKAVGDWTNRLLKLAGEEEVGRKMSIDILLDGPYGSVSVDIFGSATYSHCVLLSEGLGVAPMRSIVTHLHHECSNNQRSMQRVRFVWSAQDRQELETLLDESSESVLNFFVAANTSRKTLSPSFRDAVTDTFSFDFYVSEDDRDTEASASRNVHFGAQPDISSVLRDVGNQAIQHGKRRVAVLVCGSKRLVEDTLTSTMQLSRELKLSFDVHIEHFTL